MTYETLKFELMKAAHQARQASSALSREQFVDWAYGTCVIENRDVTREMAERAVDDREARRAASAK